MERQYLSVQPLSMKPTLVNGLTASPVLLSILTTTQFVKDWRWLEYMQYGFVSVYRFWSDGLRARETTGQVFWSFDIQHLLDLVKWYSHIEGMAERLRIHGFDRWLFQKMHSELAASARTCVLGPNRPDVRNYKLCLKSQVKDFLCLQNVPSETRFQNLLLFWWSFSHSISFNHPFTSVTLLTLSRSVVLRWHLGSRADKLWEGADGQHSPGNVANSTRCGSKGEGQQQTRANLCESMRICLYHLRRDQDQLYSKHFDCLWCARDVLVSLLLLCFPINISNFWSLPRVHSYSDTIIQFRSKNATSLFVKRSHERQLTLVYRTMKSPPIKNGSQIPNSLYP